MSISRYIEENLDALLEEWETAARAEIVAARESNSLALRDHFPRVIKDLKRALGSVEAAGSGREAGRKAFREINSIEHGRHRAAMDGYTVGQIMQEFIILRAVIADAIQRQGLWNHEQMEAVTHLLELCSHRSVAEFARSLEEVQQRTAGMLAHDIRTPLTTAKSGLLLLKEEKLEREAAREVCEMAVNGVDRALSMLAGLLDSITAEAGDGVLFAFEEADFGKEISDACQEALRSYGTRIDPNCPEQGLFGVFDAAAIRRVVENLIANAICHGEPGQPVQVKLEDEGATVALSVNNRGAPIGPERRKSIFAFLSSQSSRRSGRQGWGIGLAFVKLAAEAHRGSVELESDESTGTTFRVRLPKFSRKPGRERIKLLSES